MFLFKTAFYEPDGAVAISEIQNYPTDLLLSIILRFLRPGYVAAV
jgi:hypothetical protein